MANALYDKGREYFLGPWLTDNIKAVLVDTALYTPDLATDQFLSDIPVGARVATSGNLSGKTATGGVADAADVVLTLVTGDPCEAVVLFKDTGDPETSPLLVKIDTATGLPVTPGGGNIGIAWSDGDDKIFKL